ncbi:MAG: hypothetical protein OEX81_03420 [Candidatus Pacebacteria bacterium]|nr:hypothetical protein [Candidatus Paceibacterota bacterium]
MGGKIKTILERIFINLYNSNYLLSIKKERMKKLLFLLIFSVMFLAMTPQAFAGAKNAIEIHWSWNNPETPGNGAKSAFFQKSKSGLINAWTYNHPDLGDARFIFKPVDKFKNATECDEGWVRENTNWTARGIYNAADSDNKVLIKNLFDNLDQKYLFCAYPMN